MAPRAFIVIVGLLVLFLGVAILLWPVKPDPGQGHQVSCNNALVLKLADAKNEDGMNRVLNTISSGYPTEQAKQCEDTASTRRLIGFPLAGIGLIAFAAAAFVRTSPTTASPDKTTAA